MENEAGLGRSRGGSFSLRGVTPRCLIPDGLEETSRELNVDDPPSVRVRISPQLLATAQAQLEPDDLWGPVLPHAVGTLWTRGAA